MLSYLVSCIADIAYLEFDALGHHDGYIADGPTSITGRVCLASSM